MINFHAVWGKAEARYFKQVVGRSLTVEMSRSEPNYRPGRRVTRVLHTGSEKVKRLIWVAVSKWYPKGVILWEKKSKMPWRGLRRPWRLLRSPDHFLTPPGTSQASCSLGPSQGPFLWPQGRLRHRIHGPEEDAWCRLDLEPQVGLGGASSGPCILLWTMYAMPEPTLGP